MAVRSASFSPCVHSLGRCWDPRHTSICYFTVFSFDLVPALKLPTNLCHLAFVLHPSACCLRLLSIYPCVHSLGRCWDPRHPSICDNTVFSFDPEPAPKLRPNPCHRAFLLHSSDCYLRLLSIYPCVHSLGRCWDPRNHAICYYTVLSFDPEPVRKLRPNPWHRAFLLNSSDCYLRLLSIYPYVHSPGRCWDARHHAICSNTVFSFDPQPVRPRQPN
jgi:hypothetical protein